MNPTTEPKVWEGHNSKVVWSVWLFSVTGLLLHYFPLKFDLSWIEPSLRHRAVESQYAPSPMASYQNSSYEAVRPKAVQTVKVDVDPDTWSDWVKIPDGCTFKINRPGCWIEFLYWDNTTHRYEDNGSPQWIGTIRSSIFKLRGTKGPVEIIIESRQ